MTHLSAPNQLLLRTDKILLNLGCGQTRPAGWINADSSLNSLIQKSKFWTALIKRYTQKTVYESGNVVYMDLRRPWKFASSSIDVVYASHVFEHLTQFQTELFMREAYRVLKPGGIIRIVIPDLYQLARHYLLSFERGETNASEGFLSVLNLHQAATYPIDRTFVIKIINHIQGYPHQHKYMYDALSLKQVLSRFGFVQHQESSYGCSHYIPEIEQVEYTREGVLSAYVESFKPD